MPVGPLRLAAPALAAQFAWTLPLAVLGLLVLRLATASRVGGAVGRLGAHLRHRLQRRPAASSTPIICRPWRRRSPHWPASAASKLWRRGSRHLAIGLARRRALAGLHRRRVAGLDVDLDRLSRRGAAGGHRRRCGAPSGRRRSSAASPCWSCRPLWALSAVFAPGNLTLPSASLPRWLGIDDGRGPILSRNWTALTDDPKLQAFLQHHRGDARFLLAAPNALLAAPVIIGTGQPVMAFGGFFGNDPVMSVDAFAKTVERGEVRFVRAGHQPPHARLRALGARPRHAGRSRPVALAASRAAAARSCSTTCAGKSADDQIQSGA